MKININVHSAASAMVWWSSTQMLSELFIVSAWRLGGVRVSIFCLLFYVSM